MLNKLQLIHVDLKAAQTESEVDVARPDCFDVPLSDHVLCPVARVHSKAKRYFESSRVVLEPVPLEMCFN